MYWFEFFERLPLSAAPLVVLGSALFYGLNHLQLGSVAVISKFFSGMGYAMLYLLSGKAILVPLVAHLAQNALTLLWTRSLWYLSEKSRWLERMVLFLMRFLPSERDRIKSVVLTVSYLVIVFFGVLGIGLYGKVDLNPLVCFNFGMVKIALLGFLAQVGCVGLGTGFIFPVLARVTRRYPAESIRRIPWIRGILAVRHPFLCFIIPGLSGFFEEFFFRGILFIVLWRYFALPVEIAVLIVTVSLVVQQLLQLQTVAQMVILGYSCLVISAVGSLMTLEMGSVIPAAIAHFLFAVFYVKMGVDE